MSTSFLYNKSIFIANKMILPKKLRLPKIKLHNFMVFYWHRRRAAFDFNSAIWFVESDNSNSFAFIPESSRYINQLILPNESSG